eukprot:CAMPEP_0170629950 /NCGR_PEP_ID=MMETSP0224-20130122/33666_1 /TAXON_ID=285029 /ORGANISM="Togula jolla, Strain CCCM 725" /LENGTH=46 /DNA_ID= /DNA_START= /DNA_END= /DNA_ORIENTATION=
MTCSKASSVSVGAPWLSKSKAPQQDSEVITGIGQRFPSFSSCVGVE